MIGPEGYGLVVSNSSWELVSSTTADSRNTTDSIGGGGSIGPTYFIGNLGINFGTVDNTSHSETDTAQTGHRKESASSFNTGLFMPDAPIPDAPVGSLVAVLVPRDGGGDPLLVDAIDRRMITQPHTTFISPVDADVYFVVNDTSCTRSTDRSRLKVKSRVLTGVQNLASAFVASMGQIEEYFDSQSETLIAQGQIIYADSDRMQSWAVAITESATHVGFTQMPGEFISLHNAYVKSKLAVLEKQVRVISLTEDLVYELVDYERIERQIELVKKNAEIANSLVTFASDNLILSDLEWWASALRDVLNERFLPIAPLWVPDLMERAATPDSSQDNEDPATRLIQMDVESPVYQVASDALRLSDRLRTLYSESLIEHAEYDSVVVWFHNTMWNGIRNSRPSSMSKPWPEYYDTRKGFYQHPAVIPHLESDLFWQAVYSGRVASISIPPDTLYTTSTFSNGQLVCDRYLPIVRKAYLVVGHHENEQYSFLNSSTSFLYAQVGSQQEIVGSAAVRNVTVEKTRVALPHFHSGSRNTEFFTLIDSSSSAKRRDSDILGISPFTTFSIDFSDVRNQVGLRSLGFNVLGTRSQDDTREVGLLMFLESQSGAQPISSVQACFP
jgi:hypothetical protein